MEHVGKVPLIIREKIPNFDVDRPDYKTEHITHALPFYRSNSKKFGVAYVHRIRSGRHHCYRNRITQEMEYSHTSLSLWCGGCGGIGGKDPRGQIFAEAPEKSVFCATCEGRAVGAGMYGARLINGRFVLYKPRI